MENPIFKLLFQNEDKTETIAVDGVKLNDLINSVDPWEDFLVKQEQEKCGDATNENRSFVEHGNCCEHLDNLKLTHTLICTGEKDIDQKDIYLGDLLQYDDAIYKVVFGSGSFSLKRISSERIREPFVTHKQMKIIGSAYIPSQAAKQN